MADTLIRLTAAVLPFAVSMSFTPGPNNIMVANSGAQFGFVRSLKLQAGVVMGFALLISATGFGLVRVIHAAPGLFSAMKIISIVWLLYLAWGIATAEGVKAGARPVRPVSFLQAAAFQWVNPKAWIMAFGAMTTYTTLGPDMTAQVMVIVALFTIVGAVSISTWTLFGQVMRRALTTPRRRMMFNIVMAGLLVVSVLPALAEHL